MEDNKPPKIEITPETYQTFKEMGQTVIDLKAKNKQLEEQAQQYWNTIATYKLNFELMMFCVIRFTGTFGINNAEGTMIKPEILSGEESPMRAIMKGVADLVTAAGLAEINPAKKREMEKTFEFFQWLPVIAEYYQQQKQVKVIYSEEVLKQLPPLVAQNLSA